MSCSCRQSSCPACAWGLSRVVASRLLSHRPRHLIAIEIEFTGTGSWKESLRNLVDARRRESSRPENWCNLGLTVWSSADGKLRGVLTSTGTIPSDLVEVFTRRWLTKMRVIQADELRTTLYNSVKPGVISKQTQRRAGVRLSIWARRPKLSGTRAKEWDNEALPVIIA